MARLRMIRMGMTGAGFGVVLGLLITGVTGLSPLSADEMRQVKGQFGWLEACIYNGSCRCDGLPPAPTGAPSVPCDGCGDPDDLCRYCDNFTSMLGSCESLYFMNCTSTSVNCGNQIVNGRCSGGGTTCLIAEVPYGPGACNTMGGCM